MAGVCTSVVGHERPVQIGVLGAGGLLGLTGGLAGSGLEEPTLSSLLRPPDPLL
jgi:hypothetical protein